MNIGDFVAPCAHTEPEELVGRVGVIRSIAGGYFVVKFPGRRETVAYGPAELLVQAGLELTPPEIAPEPKRPTKGQSVAALERRIAALEELCLCLAALAQYAIIEEGNVRQSAGIWDQRLRGYADAVYAPRTQSKGTLSDETDDKAPDGLGSEGGCYGG